MPDLEGTGRPVAGTDRAGKPQQPGPCALPEYLGRTDVNTGAAGEAGWAATTALDSWSCFPRLDTPSG